MMETEQTESIFTNFKNNDFEVKKVKNLKEIPKVSTLNDLIKELHRVFEEDNIDVDYVQALMSTYKSNVQEWKQYAKFDRYRYTRNLVDEGNGKFNLMVLAWAEGQGSSIHDHADSHCFMKVLSGSLKEVKFAWPEESSEEELHEMKVLDETTLKTNEVTYINDSIGLHRMENESHTEPAVSLHLYCPPFESVSLFDQRTGHKTKSKVTFWSRYGERTPYGVQEQMEDDEYENN